VPQGIGERVEYVTSLSTIKKLAVTGIVMLLTVWMVQTVFALVASVISLAMLAVLVYLGYKLFIANIGIIFEF
jgi:hypothetical protein